jgi:hypothetical protein
MAQNNAIELQQVSKNRRYSTRHTCNMGGWLCGVVTKGVVEG